MDLNRLDLNLLKIFDAVYRLRNLAEVSKEVHLSQPAVSHALARLREALGDRLFIRTPGGLEPTARCDRLAQPVRTALETISDSLIDSSDFKPENCTREFRLLLSDVGEILFVPSLLSYLHTTAPQVKLGIFQAPRASYDRMLLDREVDLVVGHLNMSRQSIREEPVFRDHCVVMRRKIASTVQPPGLTLEEFEESSHVAINPLDDPVENAFEDLKIRRNIVLRMPNYFALPKVLGLSDVLVTVPSRIARNFQTDTPIDVFDVPFPSPFFDVKMYWHTRHDSDPAHVWLRETFLMLFPHENTR
ncbi:LysR family transcriptional regulator [Paraburkholderia sp. BL23I1N1]|uniref:LysR family transcriptional regulator n=1 Tax=Paraburkholderia sp. BL23I1N1 TaxID=1938802 RepID=UPI000E70F24A|nr:LysR family transcriptional regulator [Paraburkholderia sp. BL23I1N1]RKE38659.1 LysR family transcriptional regulator [Paraburkholderia sp. BL23I1N1]